MGRLTDFLERDQKIILTGPYGTEIAERVAADMRERPQVASGVQNNKHLGAGCSALLTPEGQAYVLDVAKDYLDSVPSDQPVALVTNSFRLEKQILESAAKVRGADKQMPVLGLELVLDANSLAHKAIEESQRNAENTLISMSIGPPFDCYSGWHTPLDIDNKYHPQVFAGVRFTDVDYIMFETVPSLDAAVGAARSFTQAHRELSVQGSIDSGKNMGTVTYMENVMGPRKYYGDASLEDLAPTYDPKSNVFVEIEPEKEYTISLVLDKNGNVHGGGKLFFTLNKLYNAIKTEGLIAPAGITLNCNSPEVVEKALEQLARDDSHDHGGRAPAGRDPLMNKIIGIHPNASPENDPQQYGKMKKAQSIPAEEFAQKVVELADKYNLSIIGGCCGTNAQTMTALHHASQG